MHHVSIRTANIHSAIAFYENLGFTIEERFTTGYTLACWLVGLGGRIELIQIPEPKAPPDPFNDEHYVGYYHISFDLTGNIDNLSNWLTEIKLKFSEDNPLTILLEPTQQMIGDRIYEVVFLGDRDGLPLEFINRLK